MRWVTTKQGLWNACWLLEAWLCWQQSSHCRTTRYLETFCWFLGLDRTRCVVAKSNFIISYCEYPLYNTLFLPVAWWILNSLCSFWTLLKKKTRFTLENWSTPFGRFCHFPLCWMRPTDKLDRLSLHSLMKKINHIFQKRYTQSACTFNHKTNCSPYATPPNSHSPRKTHS